MTFRIARTGAFSIGFLVMIFVTAASSQQLSIISDCEALFQGWRTDQATKDNLKHIDAFLVDLTLANDRLKQETARFTEACRRLKGDLNQTGPEMDAMVKALHALERASLPVKERAEALSTEPEQTLFNLTSARALREYRQPACRASIVDRTASIVSNSRDLLAKTDIDCANPQ